MRGDQTVLARSIPERCPVEQCLLLTRFQRPVHLDLADELAKGGGVFLDRPARVVGTPLVGLELRRHRLNFTMPLKTLRPAGAGTDVPRFTSAGNTRDCHTRTMRTGRALRAGLVAFGVALLLPVQGTAATPHVGQADLVGDINTIMAAYITNAVARAETDHADALLVVMNTIDGRSVPRSSGSLVLHTNGARIEDFPMPYWQVFLNALIDPTVAALLFLLAAYGIITELTTPGAILPGVVGGIAAVLALVSLANLPVNIAGAMMLLLAMILFLADLKANTHGILSFGGVLSLIVGMAFLINTGPVGLGVNPVVIFGSAAITVAFFVFFVDRVVRSRRRQGLTGGGALVGSCGGGAQQRAAE